MDKKSCLLEFEKTTFNDFAKVIDETDYELVRG